MNKQIEHVKVSINSLEAAKLKTNEDILEIIKSSKKTDAGLKNDMLEVQKRLKESQLDRKFEVEDGKKFKSELKSAMSELKLEHSKLTPKFVDLEKHVDFVHQEVAKSIHIIDKHSVEMDELSFKMTEMVDMRQQFLKLKETNAKLINLPAQIETLKAQVQESELKAAVTFRKKSITPPSPKPRDKSPGVFRTEIDELKSAVLEDQTSM